MSTDRTIIAKEFLDPDGRIVESGAMLADEIVRRLLSADVVTIDLREMRGLSSSYFNVVLQRVVPATGIAGFRQRVQFRFETQAQEQVFARSFEVARRSVA